MTTWCLYRIRCLKNGKTYVGVTHNYKARIAAHLNTPANPLLKYDLRAYGKQAFSCRYLFSCRSLEYALRAEIRMIAKLRSRDVPLYNLRDGGEHPWSDDARLFDARLRSQIMKASNLVKVEKSPRMAQLALLPYRDMAQHAKAVAELARSLRKKEKKKKEDDLADIDDRDLGAYMRRLRNQEEERPGYLFYGTDRMSVDEQAAWLQTKGPVLKMTELPYRCDVTASAWPDRVEWHAAYIDIARHRARYSKTS